MIRRQQPSDAETTQSPSLVQESGRPRLRKLTRSRSEATPTPMPAAEPAPQQSTPAAPRKKDAPTPTRREAERARMERLHPSLSPKEQKAAERAAQRERRMAATNAVENSPERRLIRNVVDDGWHIGEFTMPLMLVLIALTFVASAWPQLVLYVSIAMWALLVGVAVDIAMTWRKAKRTLRERLGTTNFRTLFTYTMNRVIQIRRFRTPPPVIKRGEGY